MRAHSAEGKLWSPRSAAPPHLSPDAGSGEDLSTSLGVCPDAGAHSPDINEFKQAASLRLHEEKYRLG